MDDNGIQPDCFTAARRWSSNASVIRGSQPKTSLSGIFLRSTLLFIAFANIIPWDFHLSTRSKNVLKISIRTYLFLPQHFLYFLPLPHGHGSFLPTFAVGFADAFSSSSSGLLIFTAAPAPDSTISFGASCSSIT